ncbi:MAG TPA: hypothetical protein VGQ82_09470 [Chthoniobacterales bacterium]|nr:hypothetical protein [Chthoniobacterales bacterium]
MRIFVAGILGGIAMFIWSSIAHMALPLGEAGIREIPAEDTVLASLKFAIGDTHGLYLFPGPALGPNPSREQKGEAMRRMAEKAARGPNGLLLYHPSRPFTMGRWLAIEFATELIESILAVFLLAQTRILTFGGRITFMTVAGVLAAIATNIPYWNWYGFPAVYTAAYMFTQIVGFMVAGLTAALVLRNRAFASSAA